MLGKGHHKSHGTLRIMWHHLKEKWREYKGARGLHGLDMAEKIANPFFWANLVLKARRERRTIRELEREATRFRNNKDLQRVIFTIEQSPFAPLFNKNFGKELARYVSHLRALYSEVDEAEKPKVLNQIRLLTEFMKLREMVVLNGESYIHNFLINNQEYYKKALENFNFSFKEFLEFMQQNDRAITAVFSQIENQTLVQKPNK